MKGGNEMTSDEVRNKLIEKINKRLEKATTIDELYQLVLMFNLLK